MAEVVLHLVRDEDEHANPISRISIQRWKRSTNEPPLSLPLRAQAMSPTSQSPWLRLNAPKLLRLLPSSSPDCDRVRARERQAASHETSQAPAKSSARICSGEAVSVTSTLYRSGESEYLLNNRLCRLRDIQDLFSGTGLAGALRNHRAGTHRSSPPRNRWTVARIIEEAAGITKFASPARLKHGESARSNLSGLISSRRLIVR